VAPDNLIFLKTTCEHKVSLFHGEDVICCIVARWWRMIAGPVKRSNRQD
jgi:hypothetical protein